MSFQKTIILGRIGKIEQRFTPDGTSVVNFSVAVNDRYKKKDGTQVDEVEWFNCVSFGKQSEIINQYFQKGSRIMIEGKLKTRQWQDQQGAKRYNTDLKVSEFSFVDKLSESNQQTQSQPQQQPQQQNYQEQRPQQQSGQETQQQPDQQQNDNFIDQNMEDEIPF